MASTDAPYQELQDSDTTTSPALKEVVEETGAKCSTPPTAPQPHNLLTSNLPGKKEYTLPPWHPHSLGLSLDLEVTEQKLSGVHHFLGEKGERLYTIGPERRVCAIEASDPEKERKEGFHGGVYFFLP